MKSGTATLTTTELSAQLVEIYERLRAGRKLSSMGNPDGWHVMFLIQAKTISTALGYLSSEVYVTTHQIARHSYADKATRDGALSEAVRLGFLKLREDGKSYVKGENA